MDITFLPKRPPARAFAATALAAAVAAAPAAAQTGAETPPPPASSPSSPSSSSKAAIEHFVATAAPTAYFLATASRLALSNSRNSKIQKFAETMAKDQTEVANSLEGWVNVNSAVVTSRSPYTGRIGRDTAKLSSPNLLPSQVSDLHRLSPLQGKDFDTAYVSTVMSVLVQLENLYSDYSKNGTEPGLLAIASRQSPKLEQAISTLDALDKENK